jgi:YD repeat-containing protein
LWNTLRLIILWLLAAYICEAQNTGEVIDDKSGAVLEAYGYDQAGNMVEKTLDGQKTSLTYNAANELVSATGPSGSASYSYDKAGRMVSNGAVTNSYGWLDKVVATTGAAGAQVAMAYWPDGQLAAEGPAPATGKAAYDPGRPGTECFLWDGLALLRRNDMVYITEPHPSGGAVVASHPIYQPAMLRYYLNDLLGTSLACVYQNKIEITRLTSFGQLASNTSSQPVNSSPNIIIPPANPLPKTDQISPTGN